MELSEAEISLTMSVSCSESLRLQDEISLFDDVVTDYPSSLILVTLHFALWVPIIPNYLFLS